MVSPESNPELLFPAPGTVPLTESLRITPRDTWCGSLGCEGHNGTSSIVTEGCLVARIKDAAYWARLGVHRATGVSFRRKLSAEGDLEGESSPPEAAEVERRCTMAEY
jgi:hypothetical protein